MTTHISDDLPRLLTGDATREVVMDAAVHLRTCVDCQQELISAVVAHASLTSAHRFAPEIVAAGHNLDAVADEDDPAVPSRLPDLTNVFAEARADATVTPLKVGRTRRRLAAVAAAAAIVVGGGVTLAVVQSGDSGPSQRTVALQSDSSGRNAAQAILLSSSRMRINATSLPVLDSQHQYEVWLTDADGSHKQSIGFIDNNRKAEFSVPSKVMSQYNNIAVSVQQLHQTEYSGHTVLHGSYG